VFACIDVQLAQEFEREQYPDHPLGLGHEAHRLARRDDGVVVDLAENEKEVDDEEQDDELDPVPPAQRFAGYAFVVARTTYPLRAERLQGLRAYLLVRFRHVTAAALSTSR
jgi:hypothetical protein